MLNYKHIREQVRVQYSTVLSFITVLLALCGITSQPEHGFYFLWNTTKRWLVFLPRLPKKKIISLEQSRIAAVVIRKYSSEETTELQLGRDRTTELQLGRDRTTELRLGRDRTTELQLGRDRISKGGRSADSWVTVKKLFLLTTF